MELLSGGEMLIRALADQGVKYIYGYPGGSLLHIYDALYQQDRVKHILTRHEQAAAHMADGYARATGEAGVVMVTSGPGATNTITGIATAYTDSIPMVVISGQVMSYLIGDDAFQETDMLGLSRPIVKHSFSVQSAKDIPLIVKKAFYIAQTGRPGPVVIDIPKDRTHPGEKFPYSYAHKVDLRSYTPTVKGHAGQIKRAYQLLSEAKQPVVYSGGGVILAQAAFELRTLVETANLPITSTLMGLGAFPGTDARFLGMLGMHGHYVANMAMHHADVILALGVRFDDRVTNAVSKFCPNAKIIHIDVDPSSISKNMVADIPIVGSAKSVLKELNKLVEKETTKWQTPNKWWDQISGWRKKYPLTYRKDSNMIKPQAAIRALWQATDGEAYITSDVGQHQMFTAQHYPFKRPNQWINSGGLGTMGFGFPAAMGIALNFPDSQVVCVTGEGSIQMNIQELSTCMQYNLPVKIFCLNNGYLGMVRQWQDMNYEGRHSHSYMESLPDFVKLAEAYGHIGIKIHNESELKTALQACFGKYKNRLVFMDVIIDPEEHVYPMQIPMGSMCDMWISKTERT